MHRRLDHLCGRFGQLRLHAGGRKLSQTDAAGNATVIHYADDGTMLSNAVDAGGVTEMRFEYDPTYPVMTVRERGPKS